MRARVLSVGKMRILSLVVVLIVAAGGFVAAFGLPGAGAQTTSYTGCVNFYTGNFRVLLYSSSSCNANEIPITFGETGPPGPQGPPGPPGPAGTLESAIHVGYNGVSVPIASPGTVVPFDTIYSTVGANIIGSIATSTFTVTEGGAYRVEFILQGAQQASGGAQVRVNGVATGPVFKLPAAVVSVGNEQQLVGTVMLDLAAGDVIDIFAGGASPATNTITSGTSVIVTQLTSTGP